MRAREGEVYERPQIGDRHVCARVSLLLCQSHLLDWRLVFHRLLRPCVLGITSPLIPLQRGTFGWRRHFGWRRCEGVCGWVYERPQIGDRHVCARVSLLLCQSHLLGWRLVFHRLLRPCVLRITSPLIPLQRGTFGWRWHFGWRRCEGVCGWGSMG